MSEDIKNISINIKGLSEAEVSERKSKGLVNKSDISGGKSTGEIIASNIFTYFNLIFLILTMLLISAHSYRNLTFLPVVVINILAGIYQELHAKHILDKMNILNAARSKVIRNGTLITLPSSELVQDDTVLLEAGDQICADALVEDGSIRVNEALLTGEADEISKKAGDFLLSGSFVVAGSCFARLKKVGNEAYVSKLTAEAKAMRGGEQSEMIRCINAIVKWLGIAVIPIGTVLFLQAHYINHETYKTAITSMVAAVIGMIPEGLYLLTTAALALGTVRLAKKNVLLHDMKSIETLARVDVLCVDKTGTVTEPDMCVADTYWFESSGTQSPSVLFADYVNASSDTNSTMQALKKYVKDIHAGSRRALSQTPFSSALKYGTVTFDDGTYILGAPEFVMKYDYSAYAADKAAPFQKAGNRVLLFGKISDNYVNENSAENNNEDYNGANSGFNGCKNTDDCIADGSAGFRVTPIGLIILNNPIRKNAPEIFSYFSEQDVAIKVISGDNPETVSAVAKAAGIKDAENYIDASLLDSDDKLRSAAAEYTVFGRVSPEQKRLLVRALQSDGHTVAMTGDGVNDILAMKDADCSIAMASGSEAAAQAAQAVLLDSDFAHMPDVVLEGRRAVNNIQRSSSLFLVKNMFSLAIAIISVIFSVTYPLQPAQISLIAMFTIGTPGFLLALEKSTTRIQGHFLKNVLMKALPAAVTDVIAVCVFMTCGDIFNLADGETSTAAVIILSLVGFLILIYISRPLNRWRSIVLAAMFLCWIFCCRNVKWWFGLSEMSFACSLLTVVFAVGAESVFRYTSKLCEFIDKKLELGEKCAEKRRKKYSL